MNARLKKAIPMIIVLLLALLLFVIKQCRQETPASSTNRIPGKEKTGSTDRDRGFDRRISYLEYSRHAKCRMDCRRITQAEVELVMQQGKINYNKSDLQNARCPRYALEGITADDQEVRIVFAQCNEKTTVVTVIDLDQEWSCDCPGDDKKYDNKN